MKKVLKKFLIVLLLLAAAAGLFIHVTMRRLHLTKVEDYLYTVDCGHVSPAVADKLLRFIDAEVDVACSSVRKGDLHARNFDWYYNEDAEYVVRCGGHGEKYASVGVASITSVSNRSADKGRYNPIYHFLQLYTVDGINEAGLAVNTNTVPEGDVGATFGTNPGGMRLCSVIIPRYLLDNAGSVDEAIELLQAADIYSYVDKSGPFELHFMISDPEKTAVVEFIDNRMVVLYDKNILTNYYLALDHYTEHAMGIERYDILEQAYDTVSGEEDMLKLMESVWFSKTYTQAENFWFSEDYGTVQNEKGEVFSINSAVEDFRSVLEAEKDRFEKRSRADGDTWHTTHTSLYDLKALTLTIVAQENGDVFRFNLAK